MRTIVALAFVLALFSQVQSIELEATNCYLVLDYQVGFNLLPWSKQQTYSLNCTSDEIGNCSVNVGFCSAYFGANYATANFSGDSYNFTNAASYTAVNATNASSFIVTYAAQQGNSVEAELNFQFVCNPNQPNTTVNNIYFNASGIDNGTYYANYTVSSEYGCGASLSQLLAFMAQYKFIFIPVFFILGAFFCFFGRRTFDIALFLIVAMGGVLISGSLFMQLTNITSAAATKWVIFGVCILIGVGLGYLAIKFEKVGFFGLGLVLGVVGGFFLYQLILSPILASHDNTASSSTGTIVFWVTIVILGMVGGFLGMWLSEDIKIISTAVIGAYTMVRSISVLIGGFPPEIQVAEGTAQFTPVAYAYLVFIIIFAILGLYVQFKHKKEDEDNKNEGNADNYQNNIPDYA